MRSGVWWAEVTKLRRSPIVGVTFLVYLFMALVLGGFFWLAAHPDVAGALGLIGTKARVALDGEVLDASTFLRMVLEIGGVGGLFLASVIVTFVFGREDVDQTTKVLLTLPIARHRFVTAKLGVSTLWFLALTLWLGVLSTLVAQAMGLPGLSVALVIESLGRLMILGLLVMGCTSLTAWVTVVTRGYFAPLGYAVFTLVLASLLARTGWGPWAPWSIVGVATGMAGPDQVLGWPQYAVVAFTFVLGTGLTMVHLRRADCL